MTLTIPFSGKILLDLRQRFRENRTGAFELCISVARMLAAYLKVDQHQTGPEEASFPETGNLIQVSRPVNLG